VFPVTYKLRLKKQLSIERIIKCSTGR